MHKVIDLVNVYEHLICSISSRLYSLRKTWKMHIKGPGKSSKNHFKCSVCIPFIVCCSSQPVCLWWVNHCTCYRRY